ncbi:hypothetical protein EV702DRAFT_1049002 [Suillus placidus]|uniref:Uncharacterized protein n=1 Tax=Suillus placidus TaxID=48579 RepID=A0A9P6ZMG3_9AGAM|nr:hypothetical protein EV702DRAFT_1049002 [Suillus placidus]
MFSKDDEIEDTLISVKEIYRSSPIIIRDWQEFVHPMGGTYYYNKKKRTWMVAFFSENVFNQANGVIRDLNWRPNIGETHKERNWLLSRRILYILHKLLLLIHETSLICQLGHYQYLHRHNQPEARLIQSHAVREKHQKNRLVSFFGSAAAIVLCMPLTIECIQATSMDGIVNSVEVRRFVNDFSNQAKSQITLAGVAMALDVAILAVPGLGTSVLAAFLPASWCNTLAREWDP